MIIILSVLETPRTMWNNPISHRFISLLSDIIPFSKAQSHHYADEESTSNQIRATDTIFIFNVVLKFSDIFQIP